MANFTKTTAGVLLAHTKITHPDILKGSSLDVSTALGIGIYIYHASIETNTPTAGALPELHIEANPLTTDESWDVLPGGKFTFSGTAPVTEALTDTEPSGETVMAVAATTDFPLNSRVYISDATADADGEWHRINTLVAATSYTLKDPLVNGKTSADSMYSQAEHIYASYDLQGIHKLRCWYMNRPATGNDTNIVVYYVLTTAIG